MVPQMPSSPQLLSLNERDRVRMANKIQSSTRWMWGLTIIALFVPIGVFVFMSINWLAKGMDNEVHISRLLLFWAMAWPVWVGVFDFYRVRRRLRTQQVQGTKCRVAGPVTDKHKKFMCTFMIGDTKFAYPVKLFPNLVPGTEMTIDYLDDSIDPVMSRCILSIDGMEYPHFQRKVTFPGGLPN
jgi:hypothetical protein